MVPLSLILYDPCLIKRIDGFYSGCEIIVFCDRQTFATLKKRKLLFFKTIKKRIKQHHL